ncbi:MAG: hypothetical protein O2923_00730 [Verrucomicrobia bacterium]|nr:hypothetical protein [Verrucomicrobiota bacterium]MDA1085992.1 hypothetical protein [Verrucomicrobiota bacterium]
MSSASRCDAVRREPLSDLAFALRLNDRAVNYRLGADALWTPPGPDAQGWHKDGDFFLHFLDSPEQGLLTLVLWDDVVERGGPTYIVAESREAPSAYARPLNWSAWRRLGQTRRRSKWAW